MEFKYQNIKCNIFLDTEAVIKKTEVKVKEAGTTKERQYYAQDILLEARTLLSCENYDAENPDCLNCHSISRNYIRGYEHLAKDKSRKVIHK